MMKAEEVETWNNILFIVNESYLMEIKHKGRVHRRFDSDFGRSNIFPHCLWDIHPF